jgi:ferritin
VKATIEDAFNDQLRNEYQASYLYLSMSAWFEAQDYPGFAQWMQMQSQEEKEHAMRFYDHINDRDGRVRLQALTEPETEWESPLDVFEDALEHEKKVTGQINDLYDLAKKEGDNAAQTFLHWFIEEQVEEEDTLSNICAQLEMAQADPAALLQLDRELGSRTQTELGGDAGGEGGH